MKSKALIIAAFVVATAAILFFTMRKSGSDDPKPDPSAASSGSAIVPANDGPKTSIDFLYSSEKKGFIDAAIAAFAKEHPEITVNAVAKGSLDIEQDILDGKAKPTIVSPADSLVQNLLASDWETKNHAQLFASSGEDAPAPLLVTPLVFVVWQDRADVLIKEAKGDITWSAIRKAISSNQGWPAIKGDAKWGFVKLGQTDPTRSNSGLQALLSMTLEYYEKKKTIEVPDVLDAKYQAYVSEIEKGVSKFETSTGAFMTDMIRFGPSKYDLAYVYESLAIEQIANAQGRWGELRVVYPKTTLWSDHPIALVQGSWVSEAQKKAARTFITFLKSRPVQEQALTFGFRPGDSSVAIKSTDPSNPFTKLAAHGVKVDLPPAAEPPSGQVVRNLMMMWSRVVAK